MRPIRIVTDSSSDITPQEAHALGIDVVPLTVTIGKQSFSEGDISPDDFFRMAVGQSVRTSQPPLGAFRQVFQYWVERGYQVLCVTVSSMLSGTMQAAMRAAVDLAPHVTVHDSLSISRAHAIQVLAAHQLAGQGADIPALVEHMRSVRERSHILIVLDSLDRLRQGGRAAAIMHLFDRFARVFQIKPIIALAGGEVRFAHVSRTFNRGIDYLMDELGSYRSAEYVAVVHTRRQELARQVAGRLADRLGFDISRVSINEAGAAMSSHGGEGLIGALVVSTT